MPYPFSSKPILDKILQNSDRQLMTQVLSNMIEKDALQLEEDFKLFRILLEEKGSTLGIEYIGGSR